VAIEPKGRCEGEARGNLGIGEFIRSLLRLRLATASLPRNDSRGHKNKLLRKAESNKFLFERERVKHPDFQSGCGLGGFGEKICFPPRGDRETNVQWTFGERQRGETPMEVFPKGALVLVFWLKFQ
jgi:hypothetical protein